MGTAVGTAIQGFSMIYKGKAEEKAAKADYNSKLAYNKQQLAYRRAQGAIQASEVKAEAKAQAAGLRHSADAAERAAKQGFIQADQIGAAYRVDLSTTVANIRAIRASTGASATSPSSIAYIEKQEKASNTARKIRVGGVRAESAQANIDALFYRESAKEALIRANKTAKSIRKASKMGTAKAGLVKPNGSYVTSGLLGSLSYFADAGNEYWKSRKV